MEVNYYDVLVVIEIYIEIVRELENAKNIIPRSSRHFEIASPRHIVLLAVDHPLQTPHVTHSPPFVLLASYSRSAQLLWYQGTRRFLEAT